MTNRPSWIRIDVPKKYEDAVKKELEKNCPEIKDEEVTYVGDEPDEPEPDEQQENDDAGKAISGAPDWHEDDTYI